MIKNSFELTLQWSEYISPRVLHLAFKRENDFSFEFTPGQFITFHLKADDKILRRSYSVATIPGKSELIEIAAGYVKDGIATNTLFNLKPGESLTTTGPFGRLVLRENEQPQRYIFIATGTGITPYRSMLPQLIQQLNNHSNVEIVVIEGVRNREDLLYAKDFLPIMQDHERFKFLAYYSRQRPENLQLYERSGYVQNAFVELRPDPSRDLIYLCGNPKMIDDAFALLKEYGFDNQNVRREKYISSGH